MSWTLEKNIVRNQHNLLYAIAFCLPLIPKALPVLIILFGALSVYSIFRGYQRAEMTEVSILLIAFYAFHIIGMLFTTNIDRGWFDLEVKLSLLVFPICFVGFRLLNTKAYERVLWAFLLGTTIAAIFCLGQSAIKVFINGAKHYHFLTFRYSVILHQSYFALYLIFSMIVLTYLEWPVFRKDKPWRTIASVLLMGFLSLSILLTGSKIGFVMWFLGMIGITIRIMSEVRQRLLPLAMLFVLMTAMGALVQSTPELKTRIMRVIKLTDRDITLKDTESTAMRTMIYSSAWDLVIDQPWYGQGTGDFQDALDQVYLDKKIVTAEERHFNAHNQLLQTWITLGIPGLVLLMSIFMVLLQQAWSSREWVYLGFASLFIIISLTESTLNVQAGVVFFAFFAVLFSRRTNYQE